MPLVSAAIITHNRARYLPEAVESILGQTVRDLELIVVDDGSTDDTIDVLAPYRDRIRYVPTEHAGKAAARNTAVEHADGDFVAFCDSDDYWCGDRLERQLAAFEAAPDVGMVHGQVELVDPSGRPLPEVTAAHRQLFSTAHRDGASYASYAFDCRCLSSTILVRREVFEVVGPYDGDLQIEDYDFYLRLLLDFDVLFLEGPHLASYRVHDDKTGSHELSAGQIQTAEKHLALLDEHPEIPHAREARRNLHLMIAQTWRVVGDRPRARAAALRAIRLGSVRGFRLAL